MAREHWPSADEIVRRNSPVMVEIRRQEQAEHVGTVKFLLRLLFAVVTVSCFVFFTFYWFGR